MPEVVVSAQCAALVMDAFILMGDLGLKDKKGKPIRFYYPGKPIDERKMDRRGLLNLQLIMQLEKNNEIR
jgi:hypothetical protein